MPGNQFQQKAEVKAVLASNVFTCAPSISQILAYVCERHFAGEVEKIKEYNIAVETLGTSRRAHGGTEIPVSPAPAQLAGTSGFSSQM